MLAIEALGLRKLYGDRPALDGLDLDVGAGEVFGLLGPNGGGKSTLFQILSTLRRPTSGSARVFGHDVVAEPAAVRRRIGVVFQSPSIDTKLSVRENLWHQGHLYAMSGAELSRRIDELLERFGMSGRAQDRAIELSGGLARRVEIAKSMLHRPDLLLLDEPSTGLDPRARGELWQQLVDIRETDGTSVLLTTHILDEADGCDRVAILDEGKCIARGSPAELKAEIAGEVVLVASPEPIELAQAISEAWKVEARVHGGAVRIESERAHELARSLAERYSGRVDSVTVGRPTLEDVFLARTGRAYSAAGAEA